MVFIKWFGNKQRYLKEVMRYFPTEFNAYHEPFLGSGSVYFEMRKQGLLDGKYCYLSDKNHELIAAFLCVQNPTRLEKMLEILDGFKKACSPGLTKNLKLKIPDTLEGVAAKFLYLNRVCFSGLYRVNEAGVFNVPHKKEKPTWIDSDTFFRCQRKLNHENVRIFSTDYTLCLNKAKRGDFIYLDPPYAPPGLTAQSPMYGAKNWDRRDYHNLKMFMDEMTDRGVMVVHSNSASPIIFQLFSDYEIDAFDVTYRCAADKSHNTSELVIRNFKGMISL